ncbi:MAG: glycosyltransferase [Bacteroidales bacterium]|nr:glycosyltransferase [Bacteroidales bacterium]
MSFYILACFILMLVIQLCIHWIRFSRLAFLKKKLRPKLDEELEPVSVVVCTRDAYEQLTELIPTLLRQNYPQFEVVIVNDCSEDETEAFLKDLERREPRIKCVQLRQHLNFFNGKKFPLSMGIKSASYDLIVLTDADCLPTSEDWLRNMVSCYDHGTEVVVGYARYENTSRLTNRLIRFDTLQEGMLYLSATLAGHPFSGTGKNLSYRKRLFFENKGFTSHYTMPAGDDDVFVSQVATKKNTKAFIDADNSIVATPTNSFWSWVRQRCNKYSTIRMHRIDTRAMMALHYWSQFLFYACFVALFFLKPAFSIATEIPYYTYYFPTLVVLFLLRYISQMIIYRGASRRLGEHGLLPGLILWDAFFAIATPLFRITGRMTKE